MPEPAPRNRHQIEPPPPVLNFEPIQDPRLKPRDCQVLWALCYWAWGRKPNCWPTNEQIGEMIRCSPRTVVFALGRLVAAGYLSRTMIRSDRGWYRALVITDRVPAPYLKIVEPAGGRATTVTTPPEGSCATPPPELARPPAQDLAREGLESPKGEEKELATTTGPQAGPSWPGEPEWLRVDNLTSVDVENWREAARRHGPNDPMGKIARKILERWERLQAAKGPEGGFTLGGPAPGSPAKEPRGPAEGSNPSALNLTKNSQSGQDKSSPIEHNFH